MPLMPVLAALLWAALDRQQAEGAAGWHSFLVHLAQLAAIGLPLATTHLFALKSPGWRSAMGWLLGFVAYPAAAIAIWGGAFPLHARDAMLAAAFSLISIVAGNGRGAIISILNRLPVTIDGVVIALLVLWTLALTSLFGSTPDAVNNQPLHIWFDGQRLITHPLEFGGYLLQFGIVAALAFGYYWVCRQLLIRRILPDHGWVALALTSLVVWMVYTPLAGSIILALPINQPDWSLLPSENHNVFDPQNYGFSAIAWIAIVPILLAAERLVAERQQAEGSHERVRAELHMLQQQINPHFLFNALNTVYALSLNDRPACADAVVKLSDLLRYAVYRGQDEWVPLDEEIAYLQNYLDLQLLRLGARCTVACRWPDRPTRLAIPPMLLIMLVENAFKHGIEPLEGAGSVSIDLMLDGANMRFSCVNAPLAGGECGAQEQAILATGLGLTNLRRRLELLFGERFSLVSAPDGDGWASTLACELRPC